MAEVKWEQEDIVMKNSDNPLGVELRGFNKIHALKFTAAILSAPQNHANLNRLEYFSHLVFQYCSGKRKMTPRYFNKLINSHYLTNLRIMEDETEDCIIDCITSRRGGFLSFSGLFEHQNPVLQEMISSIERFGERENKLWLEPVYALLRLSTVLIDRLGQKRWEYCDSISKGDLIVTNESVSEKRLDDFIFSETTLAQNQIELDLLEPFIVNITDSSSAVDKEVLFKRPIVKISKDKYMLALPTAVAYAAKHALYDHALLNNQLGSLYYNYSIYLFNEIHDKLNSCLSRHGLNVLEPIEDQNQLEDIALEVIVKTTGENYLHIVHIGLPVLTRLQTARLQEFINKTRSELGKRASKVETILIVASYGDHVQIEFSTGCESWVKNTTNFFDFAHFLDNHETPIEYLMLYLWQRQKLIDTGVQLIEFGNYFYSFTYWLDNNYVFYPKDMSLIGVNIMDFDTIHLRKFRIKSKKRLDIHVEQIAKNRNVVVQKMSASSYYEYERDYEIFASLDAARYGTLASCVIIQGVTVWIIVTGDKRYERQLLYDLWHGFTVWLYRISCDISEDLGFQKKVITVDLKFSFDDGLKQKTIHREILDFKPVTDNEGVKLFIDNRIIPYFHGETNDGEDILFTGLLNALSLFTNNTEYAKNILVERYKAKISKDAKLTHVLISYNKLDCLFQNTPGNHYHLPEPNLVSRKDGFIQLLRTDNDIKTFSSESAKSLINDSMNVNISRLCAMLQPFDRYLLITKLLELNEGLLNEKTVWSRTAKAVIGLHGREVASLTALRNASERSKASICMRALIEAAICECKGEHEPNGYDLDDLIGQMITIIDMGTISDAIYFKLTSSELIIYPNGIFDIDMSEAVSLGESYTKDKFNREYSISASNYSQFFGGEKNPHENSSEKDEFLEIFRKEYDIKFIQYTQIIDILTNFAIEKNKSTCSITFDELLRECDNRNIACDVLNVFIDRFVLKPRRTWLPTEGLEARDVQPWRFDRVASLTFKPIIGVPNNNQESFIFGVKHLEETIHHLIGRFLNGVLDKRCYRNEATKTYLGNRTNYLGNLFTKTVAKEIEDCGWKVFSEIKMTELGAPKQPNLGDVDVLAYDNNNNIMIIECKRLKSARTISEMAQICFKYRGISGDRMEKHLTRCQWLKENMDCLRKRFEIPEKTDISIFTPMIFSAPVPITYFSQAPLSKDDIFPLSSLNDYLDKIGGRSQSF